MKIENREQLQVKIAHCLRDNGCSSDGAPNRYFAAGKVLDLIEQSPVAQIEEKEWEVEAYKSSRGIWLYDPKITTRQDYRQYSLDGVDSILNTDVYMKNWPNEYSIHSIRIKKTREVFALGDKVESTYQTTAIKPLVIEKFEVDNNVTGGLAVCAGSIRMSIEITKQYTEEVTVDGKTYRLKPEDIKNLKAFVLRRDLLNPADYVLPTEKKVLLTTTDGVALYSSTDVIYGLYTDDWRAELTTVKAYLEPRGVLCADWEMFSTEEARQEYIEYEKPCLSQREVNELMSSVQEIKAGDYQEKLKCALDSYVIEKLAKTKLNG